MRLGLIVLLFFFCFVPSVIAANLLINPGFEDGISNWEFTPSTATVSETQEVKHSGSKAVIVTKKLSASWAYISQKVTIETDKYYKLSGWGLLNDDAIGNIKLRLYWLNSQNEKLSPDSIGKEITTKSNDFQFIETEGSKPPEGAQFVDIQAYVYLKNANPTTSAVFDDISLEVFIPPTPTPSPEPTATKTPTPSHTNTPSPTSKSISTSTPKPTNTSTPKPTEKGTATPTSVQSIVGTSSGQKSEEGGILGAKEENMATSSVAMERAASYKVFIITFLFIGIGCALLSCMLVIRKQFFSEQLQKGTPSSDRL